MEYKLTGLPIIRLCLLLCTLGTTACAAPMSPSSSAPQMVDGQIFDPLIRVDQSGDFQPGLAESWRTSINTDTETVTINFKVPSIEEGSSDEFASAEDIINSLTQRWESDPATTGAGTQGSNPCIIPTRTPPIPKGPYEVSPPDNEMGTIGVSIPLEACGAESSMCEAQILDAVSDFPIYQTGKLSYFASTDTGTHIFAGTADNGDAIMLEYNPDTGQTNICPECKPDGPSPRPICTPVGGGS